jgi:mono/diheme cytochrome c family protein
MRRASVWGGTILIVLSLAVAGGCPLADQLSQDFGNILDKLAASPDSGTTDNTTPSDTAGATDDQGTAGNVSEVEGDQSTEDQETADDDEAAEDDGGTTSSAGTTNSGGATSGGTGGSAGSSTGSGGTTGGGTTGGGTTSGDAAAGKAFYDAHCSPCHVLGTYDTAGFAPNLSGHANLVVNDMTTVNSVHTALGGPLTDQQVADLKAWISAN